MVRQASLFSQLLRQVPRDVFDQLVREHQAEKGAKGFTCWTQLVAMLFCHLGRADSLREICNGLACCVGKLVHIGIGRAPKRSSLSYANAHRPAALFEDLFWKLATRLRGREGLGQRKSKFRFKNKLLSLDSTTISLCLSLFPWARFRRAKGGVKVHVLLDHDDYMPSYVLLTEARRHDRVGARLLNLNPGSIVAMDRADNDYQLFADWTAAGIYFVTRLKVNADYDVVEHRRVPKNRSIPDYFVGTLERLRMDGGFLYAYTVVADTGFDSREVLRLDEVRWVHETLSRAFELRPLAYRPDTQLARREAESWGAPPFPVLLDERRSDLEY